MRTHQKRCVRISLLPCCRGLALCGLLLLLPRRKLPLALLALEICLYLREQAPGQGLQLVVGYPALVRSHTSPHSSLYDFLFQRYAHAWALFDIGACTLTSTFLPHCFFPVPSPFWLCYTADKIVLTFNYKDGSKTVSLQDVEGSDLGAATAPNPQSFACKGLRIFSYSPSRFTDSMLRCGLPYIGLKFQRKGSNLRTDYAREKRRPPDF